jgi:membrane protease YdiL (CAAX protease family)
VKHCANAVCPDRGRLGEYIDSIETCPRCGSELVPGAPPPTYTQTEWRDLVPVASFADMAVADLQRSLLEAAGIPAIVENEHMAAIAWPYSQGAAGIRVLVPPDRLVEAQRMLRTDASSDLDDLRDDSSGGDQAAVPVAIDAVRSSSREVSRELLEATAVALIVCAFSIVARTLPPSSDDVFAQRIFASKALREIGWSILLCHLLNQGKSFRWNLPASATEWVGEVLWGVGLFLAMMFVSMRLRQWAEWIGLESHPSPWDPVFDNPRFALSFSLLGPISVLYQELLFRVYAQTRLSTILGRWSACSVLISAGLYALSHAHSLAHAFVTFGSGLVLGIAYQVSKKVPRLVVARSMPLILP